MNSSLEGITKRLSDAHKSWVMANSNYFEPDVFLFHAQHCIQSLRTVTFVLQAQKKNIPDFNKWYTPFQEKMRADKIMKWAVNARNKIEKVGDLETNSQIKVTIIASYYDELPEIKGDNICLSYGVYKILSVLPIDMLDKQVLRHGAVKIERRWVDNELPDYELLNALAHVFYEILSMIENLYEYIGENIPTIANMDIDNFRLSVLSDDIRTSLFSLDDGNPICFSTTTKKMDKKYMDIAKKEYINKSNESLLHFNKESLREYAHSLFECGRNIFNVDGYHQPMMFLINLNADGSILKLKLCITPMEDRCSKYLIMRTIAKEINALRVDAVIFIGEVWLSNAEELSDWEYPSDDENRLEELCMFVSSKKNKHYKISAPIERAGENFSLGKTSEIEIETSSISMFEPILEIWRLTSKV